MITTDDEEGLVGFIAKEARLCCHDHLVAVANLQLVKGEQMVIAFGFTSWITRLASVR